MFSIILKSQHRVFNHFPKIRERSKGNICTTETQINFAGDVGRQTWKKKETLKGDIPKQDGKRGLHCFTPPGGTTAETSPAAYAVGPPKLSISEVTPRCGLLLWVQGAGCSCLYRASFSAALFPKAVCLHEDVLNKLSYTTAGPKSSQENSQTDLRYLFTPAT